MNHLRIKFVSLGGLIFVGALIFFLMRSEDVQAAWSYRNNEAIDATFACKDGIYIGVGHDGSIVGQDIIVTANLVPSNDVIATATYVPPPNPDPDTPPYAGYYFLPWDEAYQPLPVGSEIYIDPFYLIVADCLIDPEDSATGTGFTYQGRLEDGGNPVNGTYDIRFRLFNSASGGSQVGSTVWKHDIQINDGLFTVELDFGAAALDSSARWIQIGVRPGNSTGSVTVLNPRQALTAVPYAQSLRAGAVVSGTVPGGAVLNLRNNIGDGLHIDWAATGIHVESTGEDGILLENVGANGLTIDSPGGYGLSISNPGGAGINMFGSGGSGINIYSPDGNGVYVSNATSNGFYAYNPTGAGFTTWSPDGDGFSVSSAGDDGLYVGSAIGDGIEVFSADEEGIAIEGADFDGIDINSAAFEGIEVSGAATYQGYFIGDVYVSGSCVNCLIATFGLNTSSANLGMGDIVSIQGIQEPANIANQPVLFEVAHHSQGQPVIGVVQGRAELLLDDEIDAVTNRPREYLVPREGPAAPGDYVHIIIYGPMQVRANTLNQTIAAGDRLAVNDGGQARALQTVNVDGVQLAESAPTIGIALEDLATNEADGLIWVLVNPH